MPGVGRSRRGFSFELTGSCAAIRRLRGILPALTLDSLDGRGTHSGMQLPETSSYLGKCAGEFQLLEENIVFVELINFLWGLCNETEIFLAVLLIIRLISRPISCHTLGFTHYFTRFIIMAMLKVTNSINFSSKKLRACSIKVEHNIQLLLNKL